MAVGSLARRRPPLARDATRAQHETAAGTATERGCARRERHPPHRSPDLAWLPPPPCQLPRVDANLEAAASRMGVCEWSQSNVDTLRLRFAWLCMFP